MITLFSNDIEPNSDYEMASIYLQQGNYEEYSSIMANLPSKYNFNDEEIQQHYDYSDFFDIIKYLQDNNMNYEKLSSSQIEKLYQLYENDRSFASAYARSALMKLDENFSYIEPIYLPVELKMGKPYHKTNIEVNNVLIVFPNPARDFATVAYEVTEPINDLRLIVSDALGKVVYTKKLSKTSDQQIIVVKDFAKGNYICTIYNNGKPIRNTKFIKK